MSAPESAEPRLAEVICGQRCPFGVYWDNIPALDMVERFNGLADRNPFEFEAWFNDCVESDRSWDLDESGIRSDYHAGTTWAVKGKTPVVQATGARFSLNMIPAVNALGHLRFMTVEGNVTAKVFREFLRRLISGMDREIILIVDGHPTHRAKLVKRFVEDDAERLELVFLPPYSPELNPDEWVLAHVKKHIAKTTSNTKDAPKRTVDWAMRSLQKMPDVVSGFFHAPMCSYAKSLG